MEEDLKCAPRLPGCGTQHPHRALDGTRVLLAAAPTTPPCFRRWRRSSLLQRKNYFKFWGTETPAGVSVPFFHGWGNPFRLAASRQATFPKGTALAVAGNFATAPKGVPLGELASAARLRGFFRPKFHVLGRKSQTIKQSAQKGGTKFGGGGFDRSRENTFEKQQNKLKRTIATNSGFARTNKISGHILFDMGTIPKKY